MVCLPQVCQFLYPSEAQGVKSPPCTFRAQKSALKHFFTLYYTPIVQSTCLNLVSFLQQSFIWPGNKRFQSNSQPSTFNNLFWTAYHTSWRQPSQLAALLQQPTRKTSRHPLTVHAANETYWNWPSILQLLNFIIYLNYCNLPQRQHPKQTHHHTAGQIRNFWSSDDRKKYCSLTAL